MIPRGKRCLATPLEEECAGDVRREITAHRKEGPVPPEKPPDNVLVINPGESGWCLNRSVSACGINPSLIHTFLAVEVVVESHSRFSEDRPGTGETSPKLVVSSE